MPTLEKRTLLSAYALLATSLLVAPLAVAPPDHAAHTETFTVQDTEETFADVNPCTGDAATITLLYNGAFHETTWDSGPHAGEFRVTGTLTGDVTIVPDDASLPTYDGHFTVWFGGSGTQSTFVFTETFQVKLKGSDGSSLKGEGVAHVTFANGDIRSEFETFECR